ncbi:MAG: aspartyl/asparaginyl beta-hydroxylase domain-containing protein [Steroidobacter sp.]
MSPDEIRRLAEAGTAALQVGDARTARKHFEQIVATGQANAGVWLALALACNALGDQVAMLPALERALALDPHNIRALVMKGDHLVNTGQARSATAFYAAAVSAAAQARSLPPGLVPIAKHAEAMYQRINSQLEAHVRAQLGSRATGEGSSSRFAQSVEILMGKKQRYVQEPRAYFFPELANIQFFPRETFPWLVDLEAATPVILGELGQLLGEGFVPYIRGRTDMPTRNDHPLLNNDAWSAFFLWQDGAPVPGNAERCPRTLEALAQIPLSRIPGRTPSILFSRLAPGAHIPPHTGFLNTRLICHLPLIVPPNCHLRVGNEQREWRAGEAWVFDDTIEHEANNGSDRSRVVLIFDIWRPELTVEERAQVAALLAAIDTFGGGIESWSA